MWHVCSYIESGVLINSSVLEIRKKMIAKFILALPQEETCGFPIRFNNTIQSDY